jgi:uncharacterized damage-inducible protein DinB
MKDTLTYYCHYNIWANQKIIDFLKAQDTPLLDTFVESSFPSIRKTILHIYSAEQSWLARMSQNPSMNKQIMDDFENIHLMMDGWLNISKSLLQFVEIQEIPYFENIIAYHTWDGNAHKMKPKLMIHHCLNHSTYHRGQLIMMARQLGIKKAVPSTDLLYFSRDFGAY